MLASQLLVVAGQRVKSIIATSSSPQEVIANFSPYLVSWLNTLVCSPKDSIVTSSNFVQF